jgi:hypothetical protein
MKHRRRGFIIWFLLGGSCLGGCGSGITGNLPPTTGRVYYGDDPDQSVSQAEVRLVGPEGEVIATTRTDDQGEFRFEGIPLHFPPGQLRIEVQPVQRPRPDNPNEMETLISDPIPIPQSGGRLLVSMRPERTPVDVPSLRLEPAEVVMKVGDAPLQFQVVVDAGVGLPVLPTWVLEGNVGELSPRGVFTPQHPGRGKVIVLLGLLRAEAIVRVRPR